MSSFSLKVLAVITMAVDHVGAVLFPDIILLRIIGRISFPIFAFLLVEGFSHTQNRFKYASRLFVFALISEIPYDLAFGDGLFDFSKQNVIMTFFIGFMMMWGMEKSKNWFHRILIGIIGMGVAYLLKVDYTFIGILSVLFFYILRNKKVKKILAEIFILSFLGLMLNVLEFFASIALIPIAFYNGKIGRFKIKYFFYCFYPIHLIILYLIQRGTFI